MRYTKTHIFIGTNIYMHTHIYYINICTHKQAAQQKRNAVVAPAASDWQISPQLVPPEVLSLLALLVNKVQILTPEPPTGRSHLTITTRLARNP